jgi:replicative DNA helicase
MNELDYNILKILLTNKKYALEFAHECNEKLFVPDLWRFGKLVLDYIRIYKEVPTRRVILEKVAKQNNKNLLEHITKLFDEIDAVKYNDIEYKHDLEKFKNRFAEKLIVGLKDNLTNQVGNIDLKKSMGEIQSVLGNIKGINQVKAYEQKTLRDAADEFKDRYVARLKDPNFGIGTLTGYSFFDFITGGLRPSEMLLIGADTGGGKCHAKGQGILKHDGSIIKVEDVKVGDLLSGPNGPRKVLMTNTGKDYMYDIIPVKGKSWRVNLDHILTIVITNNNKVIDVSVKDYLKWGNKRKKWAKLLRSSVDFSPAKEVLMDPYLLGVFLGDGCSRSGTFSITSMDKEIVDELKLNCKKNNMFLSIGNKDKKAKSYTLCKKVGKKNILTSYLEYYGLRYKTSHHKFIPQDYKVSNKHTRLEMLAGLIDTDGSYDGKCGFDFISASEQLANDVLFISRSVGLAAYMRPCAKSCQTGASGIYYRVYISGNTDMIPCRIARKKALPRKQIKNVLRTGFKVVPTNNIEEYYGFTLDGDGRYLLDDFTITHNSMLLMNMAMNIWQNGNTIDMESNFKQGADVLYFSLEMPYQDLHERVLSRLAMVPQIGIRDAKLTDEEQKRLAKALKFTKRYPYDFEIIDMPRGATIENIETIFNDITSSRRKPAVVVIDYLSLMEHPQKDEIDDWLKLGEIAGSVSEFGRVNEIITLSAVQLNDPGKGQKTGENQIGMHRIGRSKLILHHANFAIQIEKRPNEESFPDLNLHMIKHRRTQGGRGKVYKNLSCCALLNDPLDQNNDQSRDSGDISNRIV